MVFILMRLSIRHGAWIALTGIFAFEKVMEEEIKKRIIGNVVSGFIAKRENVTNVRGKEKG